MDLSNGKYLSKDILAVCGSWIVVFDGRYNYMLFNYDRPVNIERYYKDRLPTNWPLRVNKDGSVHGGAKYVEYYTTFDNAVKNLCKVVVNKGFLTKSRMIR